MYFLSIIIPVYNVELYINRCIDSVIKQKNFKEVEVLLIDDGSTDSSGVICDEYAKKYDNITVFHKKNGGLSDARNFALEYVKGKYIFFLDSDDFISDSFVYDMKKIVTDSEPDIISFKYCYEKKANEYKLYGNKKTKMIGSQEHLADLLANKLGNQICFNLYRKNLFDNIRFPLGKTYEDISTYYKLIISSNKILQVNYSYYIYNIVNDVSITKTTTYKNMNDMFMAVNEQCEEIDKKYINCKKIHELIRYYKLDKYAYIYIKVRRELEKTKETIELRNKLVECIKLNISFNLLKMQQYNLKKYIYVIMLYLTRKL